ncbi:hypothetical protein D0Z07_6169 [Hyphodiscus hymeniophilus]|uniref:Heterokaryon incompatibility domain-containing protein n=1 Tax=Hyphodiscus hymeniophilus TaxID=353542 RepID=A0A9P6VF91_9HELO|nr:hypothetical protein D0Z07_6169 [Hyphodiscus hymeniophilus]
MSAYSVPGSFCEFCRSITFKPWEELTTTEKSTVFQCIDEYGDDLDEDEAARENPYSVSTLYHIHHPSLETFQKSADDGCQFCYHILYGGLADALEDKEEGWGPVIFTLDEDHSRSRAEMRSDEEQWSGELQVQMGSQYRTWMRLREYKDDFDNCAVPGKHCNSNMTTGSLANLDLAAKWLRNCMNDHDCCPPKAHHNLRCLCGSWISGLLRMIVGFSSQRLPLHCTIIDNIEDRKQCIDPSILPETFSDAISVCRHLGIRFLWIDSMCIIQENDDDWDEQSKQMAEIYSRAILNISAASGNDSTAGLFVDRDPRKTHPCPFSYSWKDESGSTVTSSYLSCLDSDEKQYGYLDTRGWTFQEMYLPCRTLRFSNQAMYWTCTALNASEALPNGMLPSNNKSDFDKYIRTKPDGSTISQSDKWHKYRWWYNAVERYSSRQFTKESDRLPAVFGLASHFKHALQDEYLAGIWKADIVNGLSWRTAQHFDSNFTKRSTIGEDSLPPPPSWSWASRPDKEVNYSGREVSKDDKMPDSIESTVYGNIISAGNSNNSSGHQMFDLLDSEITSQSASPSIMSTTNHLKIRGLILEARCLKGRFLEVRSPHGNFSGARFSADLDEVVNTEDKLYCLPLSWHSTSPSPGEQVQTRLIEEDKSMVSIQDQMSSERYLLEHLGIILPGATWCGDEVLQAKFKENTSFDCLILKKVGIGGMKYRRVGFAQVPGGESFERVRPVALELI